MAQQTAPARDQQLQQLKAFGLFIRGEHTLYQIAEALGIAAQNPSTAAGRARSRVAQGWRLVYQRKVKRWERWWNVRYPESAWQSLHGARLASHPALEPTPPAPEPTPFDRLLLRLKVVEEEARAGGFLSAADGLRNLCAALRYQREYFAEQKGSAASGKPS